MSTEEKDEILASLSTLIGIARWLGGTSLVAFCGMILVLVTDHYEQQVIKTDVQWIRPRVEQLWYQNKNSVKEVSTVLSQPSD
jgi:hypothetical protein